MRAVLAVLLVEAPTREPQGGHGTNAPDDVARLRRKPNRNMAPANSAQALQVRAEVHRFLHTRGESIELITGAS